MKDLYLVSKWALIRRNELVDIPGHFEIHPDFLHELPREAFENAFREIGAMFYQMYTDMEDDIGRCTVLMNMTISPARQGRQGVHRGICAISCSACLPAVVLRAASLSPTRRKSGK